MAKKGVLTKEQKRISRETRALRPSGTTTISSTNNHQGRHVPTGKLTPKDRRHLAGTRQDLAAARRKGVTAAKGQLAGIEQNLGARLSKQSRKFSKSSERVLGQMKRYTEQSKDFARGQVRGAKSDRDQLSDRVGPTGMDFTAGDAAITGSRIKKAIAAGEATRTQAAASSALGKKLAEAGNKRMAATERVNEQVASNSQSILDVLAAERASDDARFLAQQRMQYKSMRQDEANQVRMAKLQSRLQMKYAEFANSLPLGAADMQSMQMQFRQEEAMARLNHELATAEATAAGVAPLVNQLDVASGVAADASAYYIEHQNELSGMSVQEAYAAVAPNVMYSPAIATDESGNSAISAAIITDVIENSGRVNAQAIRDAVVSTDATGSFRQYTEENQDQVNQIIDEAVTTAMATQSPSYEHQTGGWGMFHGSKTETMTGEEFVDSYYNGFAPSPYG